MGSGWHRETFAVFDTETTGVDPCSARVVTAALAVPALGCTWSWTCDPGVPIPAQASAVHGLYDADVAGCPSWEDVRSEVHDALAECWSLGPVVIMNAPYDLTVVHAPVLGPVVDPLVLDRVLRPARGSRRLGALCEAWSVPHGGQHDAFEDALACGRVAWAMCERFPWLAGMDLGVLHDRQARWHAAWASAPYRGYDPRWPTLR